MQGRRKCPRSFLFPRKMEDGAFHSTIEEGERLQIFMKSNVLTIANKSSFRKGDVKDYEEKSDRFSSRGRQKLQLKQVLSLISFLPSLSSLSLVRGKMAGDIRKYICRDGFIRGGFDSLMAFVPLPRENFQPRGDLSMQNGNLFRDILQ